MIPEELLFAHGAEKIPLDKGEILFSKDDTARFYFQVASGEIKMSSFNDEGREFIQGIFGPGESFGEPPLFIHTTYPANAIAVNDCEILRLKKEIFLELLTGNPKIHLEVTTILAKRLYYKSVMGAEIAAHEPEHRILKLIDYLKENQTANPSGKYRVDITRQQIADLTGLRVETVIRAIKSLEKDGELHIENRKVFR